MNPNWIGVLSAAGALVAFFVTYSAMGKPGKKPGAGPVLVALLLAVPGASFAVYYAHVFPEPWWYYTFRSWNGTELVLVFVGVAGGMVAALLPRALFVVPLVATLAFVVVPFLKPVLGPIRPDAFVGKWDGDVCFQSTQSTCGPASAATILKHHGIVAPEKVLAREAYSYVGGTEAWYLARAVRARGCDVSFTISDGFDPDVPLPAIAGVKVNGIGHFIPILSRNGEVFTIGDPIRGAESATKGVLLSRYEFTGFYMPISKAD